jgi:methionyl-tRNA synthetase
MNTFYITTPIYYPNARPHVGSAYTTIVCDVLARYKRMCGYDVAFLTGTDEHGEKLERAAVAAGQSPSQFVAEKRKLFVQLWEKLGIPVSVYPQGKPDSLRFIYTDHPDHITSVQRLLKLAQKNSPGVIYKGQYQGRYCVSDERYISDGSEPADCDICGRPTELISEENYFFKLSAFQNRLLELYEKHPEFVQPAYRRNEVKSFVKGGLRDISVSRKRLKWGIPWPDDPEQVFYVWYDALTSYMTGIGYAQGDQGNEEFQKYWRNRPGESELVHMIGKDILRFHAVYWPAFIMAAYPDQPEMLPTTVFAHGWIYYEQDKMSKSKGNVVYPEPIIDALDSFGAPGNDALRYYLLREAPFGQDTSFSYEGLIQRYNSDLANDLGNLANRTIAMLNRYFYGKLPSPMVDWATVAAAIDGDPVAQRRLAEFPFVFDSGTVELVQKSQILRYSVEARFKQYEISYVLANTWGSIEEEEPLGLLAATNKYLTDQAPWTLAEHNLEANRDRIATILCTAAEALRFVAIVLAPVMPHATRRLWRQLGCEEYLGKIEDQRLDQLKWGALRPGTKIGKPEPIFPRLDKPKTLAKLDELAEADRERDKTVGALRPAAEGLRATGREAPLQGAPIRQAPPQGALLQPDIMRADHERDKPQPLAPSPQPPARDLERDKPKEAFIPVQTEKKPEAVPSPQPPAPSPQSPALISIEDFAKVDMRVGEVKAAERVPGASKLLKLMVDIGTEVRQLVAGIAEYYQPENLIGMKVVVVTNLPPRKVRGVESNGMIVAAVVGEQGRPVLVTFKEDVENGARLR